MEMPLSLIYFWEICQNWNYFVHYLWNFICLNKTWWSSLSQYHSIHSWKLKNSDSQAEEDHHCWEVSNMCPMKKILFWFFCLLRYFLLPWFIRETECSHFNFKEMTVFILVLVLTSHARNDECKLQWKGWLSTSSYHLQYSILLMKTLKFWLLRKGALSMRTQSLRRVNEVTCGQMPH